MVKKIKSVLAVLLCAAFAVIPLSGVKESFGVQNVEKSAMVKSIGFDTEGENIISYVQSVIDDSSAFHTQGLISAAGCSFADAEKKAQILADKYLSFSYARHFLIGMSTAKSGIGDVMAFLLASPVLQLSSYVYICEGSAKTMLEKISKDSISTNEVLTNLNLAGKEEGYYYPGTVLELAKAWREGQYIAVPVIGEKESGTNTAKKTVPVFKGYAVIEDNRIAAGLNKDLARKYNIFNNIIQRTVISDGDNDFELKNIHTSVRFRVRDEQVEKVYFRVKAKLAFAAFSGNSLKDSAAVQNDLSAVQTAVTRELNELLSFIQSGNIDLLHLESKLDIQTFGAMQNPSAALKGAAISVAFEPQYDNNFTLK